MFVRRVWPSRDAVPEPARLLRDMERLFGTVWGRPGEAGTSGVFPALNVTRDASNLYVRAELPGVKADDLHISVEKHQLALAGTRTAPESDGMSFHRCERVSGSFDRTITLPTEFDADRVSARYEDGVLTITLPLSESSKGRRITVQTA